MSVTDDEAVSVEEGGCAVVGEFGVCEESEVHALLGDGDGEVGVCGEIFVVAGEGDERGRHVDFGRNEPLVKSGHDIRDLYHWNTVARAGKNLQSVRQGLTSANIDKVVIRARDISYRWESVMYV